MSISDNYGIRRSPSLDKRSLPDLREKPTAGGIQRMRLMSQPATVLEREGIQELTATTPTQPNKVTKKSRAAKRNMTMPPISKNKLQRSGSTSGNGEAKKKKKQVKEIDGVLWLLDDRGNPVKKVRRRNEGGESSPKSPARPRTPGKKKNVAEIDGQMFLLDEAGNPIKKIRKKGEAPKERKLDIGSPAGRKQRSTRQLGTGRNSTSPMRRQKSVRRPGNPGARDEYTDDKGRKVIIAADGSKTIIAKNGKRLRPKKKPNGVSPSKPRMSVPYMAPQDDLLKDIQGSSLFDELWNDIPGEPSGDGSSEKKSASLSTKIDEVGKENQELAVKLQEAEEEIEHLAEENKKVKAKSVKAVTEMMQVKCEYTEANTELYKLRSQVDKLRLTMKEKEKQMDDLSQLRAKALELEKVERQNQQLREELEAAKRERALDVQNRKTHDDEELEEVTSSSEDDASYESEDEDSEVSVDFATGLPKTAKESEEPAPKKKDKDMNKHIGEIQVNFNNSFMSPEPNKPKSWWALKK